MSTTPSQSQSQSQFQAQSYPPDSEPFKITRGHSCVLCQQRKVKCDRQKPCHNCIKARVECVASTPTLPRRKRKKLDETDVAAKLRKYEQLLRSHGVKLEDEDPAQDESQEVEEAPHKHHHGEREALISLSAPRPRNGEKGALFKDNENSLYAENTLWENLRDEIADPKDMLHGSSDDESNDAGLHPNPEAFLLNSGAASKNLTALHPQPVHIFRLWQTFLVNVNPLVKIFHAPTMQQMILDASGDLEKVSRPTEALMFSIYFLSVTSLTNEECESMYGESRSTLLSKYSHATQQALINCRFLKSLNLSTLQAFSIFLLGMRKFYDSHTMWVLTGVSARIAHRLGLHRELSSNKIPPFDAEMRRRTWWQVIFLDSLSSKLAGASFPSWLVKFETQVPLNVSDSDLSPGMKEIPTEKEGATEMIFCCLRYDVSQAIRKSISLISDRDGSIHPSSELLARKDKAIDELEAQLEQKYTRYCDPSLPLHLLVIYCAKSVICSMKVMAHHPRQYPDKGASLPQSEKDMLFAECLKELEIDGLGHMVKSVKGFLWHIQHHFLLDAFIYLLSELQHRLTGPLVERAWQQVQIAYEYRTELITDTRNSLYVAVGNLALKAWRKREEAGILGQGDYQMSPPRYITMLRSRRNVPDPCQPTQVQREESHLRTNGAPDCSSNTVLGDSSYPNTADQWTNVELSFDMSMPEITPDDWEYWNTLMGGDLPAYNGIEMGYHWMK